MVDITRDEYWENNIEDKLPNKKMTFENKIIIIGLILFGICIVINSVLIYSFFKILTHI